MSHYPTVKELLAKDADGILLEVKRSPRSLISYFIYLILSTIVVIILNIYYPKLAFPATVPVLHYISIRWLGLIPIIFILEILRKRHDDLYVLTLHRIEHHAGRLSLTYNVPNVRVVDVRGITVSQQIWGRIFNYGDIELGTAAQTEPELILEGVLAPYELASLIDEVRNYSAEIVTADEGPNHPASTE